jgi:nitrogen regulatory protein P-II 1
VGCGEEQGRVGRYRGATFVRQWIPRVRLEIVVDDAHAGPTAWAITDAAKVGDVGDGLVFIIPVDDAVRVRTGERGLAAIGESPGETPGPRRAAAG